jgi:hypothetical protein
MDDRTIVGWGDASAGQTTAPSNRQGTFLAVAAGWMHGVAIAGGPTINIDLPLSAYVGIGQILHITGVADGTPPLVYHWQKQSAMGYADVSGATDSTLVLSDVQASHGGNYRLVVTNDHGSATSAPVSVTTLPATTFAQWSTTQFNSTQLADPMVSGPLATPAGDGVSNLLKYAFNKPVFGPNPMAPAPLGPSGLTLMPEHTESGALRLDFHAVRTDLTYTVEACADPAAGFWNTHDVIIEANGTARSATYMPVSPQSGFIRVRVSQ